MEILVADRIVATSHDFPTVNCSIDPEDMRYISSLLRNNYSNTILATIREVYANAADANKESGLSTESIQIKSPTFLDQTFFVRDFGAGLSRDQIFNLYSKFGKSTKRNSNSLIGGYGIGRFAPLSYKDSFTVTSYHEGIKSIYSLYISEENDTKIDEIFCEPTLEANGICISVGVSSGDINKFNQEISSFFSNFEVQPHFLNLQVEIAKPEIVASGTNWQIRKSFNGYNHYSVGEQGIVMGGIYYPINPELVDFKSDDDYAGLISWTKFLNKLVFIADIGSVSLHHSRETLEYNKTTKTYLKSRYQAFCKEFTDSIKNKVAQFDCLRDAMSYYKDISQTFPRNVFDQLQNQFVFKGYKIITWNFNRSSYEENDEMIRIPVYAKNYCVSGDRVAIAKCYTVGNDKDTYIVFHDLPDNTKVVPRVYELVKKYKNVVVVAHDQSIISSDTLNGVDKFKEVNRFDLVKSGYCNLSELIPVKLPSTKKGSASSYTANYFYKVESCYFRCSSVFAKEINDSSITKLYFPVSNGKPVNNYSYFHQEKNKLNSYFFSEVGKLFNVNIYAVSNNVAATVKFKNRADFVDIIKYIQDKWNAYSDEVKSLILEYISCKTDDVYNIMTFTVMVADISTYQQYDYKLKFCSENLKKAGALEFADFFKKWRNALEILKINMSHDNETPVSICGKYLRQATEEIYKNYPMLEIHADMYNSDRIKNEVKFKEYISFMNQQNSVDFSEI
jgi:hypothetical protein